MQIRKFCMDTDFNRIDDFLRQQYYENRNMTSWLPQRFHDLVYRVDTQYVEKPGGLASKDFIYMWKERGKIVACILPDSDVIYMSIQRGYENLFPEILTFAEKNHTALSTKAEDGFADFVVGANDSLHYRTKVLREHGYSRQAEQDFDNYCCPLDETRQLVLPHGFRLVYGDDVADEYDKWSSCDKGFHPEYEDDPNFKESMKAYNERKKSYLFGDSFECLTVTDAGCICSYSFCYVDKTTSTAFIEPVSTRQKYLKKGLGSAMMLGIILKLKSIGIKKCYVNSYDWRRKFYNVAGFRTEDSISFWHKSIKVF